MTDEVPNNPHPANAPQQQQYNEEAITGSHADMMARMRRDIAQLDAMAEKNETLKQGFSDFARLNNADIREHDPLLLELRQTKALLSRVVSLLEAQAESGRVKLDQVPGGTGLRDFLRSSLSLRLQAKGE